MLALGLGVGSAVLWGVSDFLGGLTTRRVPLTVVTSASQALGLVAIGLAVLVVGPDPPSLRDAAIAGLGGIAVAIAVSAFYSALAGGTMSLVAPITAVGVSIPVMFGLLTGDDPSAIQVAGIATAAVGVVLVSRTSVDDPNTGQRRSVVLALVAALCFGWYFIAMDGVAEANLLWMLFATRIATVFVLVGVVLWVRPPLSAARRSVPALLGIGLFDLGGSAAFILAADEGLLSLVSVLGSLYAVMTILMARLLLGERINTWQKGGVFFAISGVAMIAAGA
jgi:drug/metabolite transporter (DMT)-like permease